MILTQGEFCQFSLKSRAQLLKEFGNYVCHKKIEDELISLYRIYDFYVALVYNVREKQLKQADPITNSEWIGFYKRFGE